MSILPLSGTSSLIGLPGKKTIITSLSFLLLTDFDDEQEQEQVKGMEDVATLLLEECPESMRENISEIEETCLHPLVGYKWVSERTPHYAHPINAKDPHFSPCHFKETSPILQIGERKQKQDHSTLKVMLTNDLTSIRNLVEVNRTTCGKFTLDVSPYSGNIDMEIDKLLRGAGALRARDFANYDASKRTGHGCKATINCTSRFGTQISYCVLLVISTMLAVITYLAAFSAPAIHYRHKTNNGNLQLRKSDSIVTRSFVMFNSMGFIASVAMIIFLLHEFPLKPWPQISISAMFGSYMCLIMAISPDEALPLLLLSIPFLLLAASGKMYCCFARQSFSLCS